MTYSYPYQSEFALAKDGLQEGKDYQLWSNESSIQDLINKLDKPIIEIGGPTESGFFFLDGIKFKSKPIITNISNSPLPYSDRSSEFAKQVVQLVDGREMPFGHASVGIFLMSGMSISSDWWVNLNDDEKEKATPRFELEFSKARFEMVLVSAGLLEPAAVKHAQRIQIYQQMRRCLCKDGLLFTDGGLEEIVTLQRFGFRLVALLQRDNYDQTNYEFVVTL